MNTEQLTEQLIKQLSVFSGEDAWIVHVFLVVLATMVLNFVQKYLINRLQRQLEKTRTRWDDLLLASVKRPLSLLIWLVGVSFAAEIAQQESHTVIFNAIGVIRSIGIIVIIVVFLLQLIKGTEQIYIEKETDTGQKYDKHTIEALAKLVRLSVLITAALVMLQTLGFSVSGVLAFGGIGGIAVGFAAKDLLANFFGGLMIYLDRPFIIGDWIRSNDREIEGTVEYIGWRLTRIRTFDKRPLYVPNSVFANISVENPSRMTNRRIYETVGIRYEDAGKMDVIVSDVKNMLCAHPEIDTQQTMIVNFNKFAPSSIDFFVYTFTKTTEWIRFHEIKQDVLLKIMDIIQQHGAEVAFPTSTLHIESLPQQVES